MAFANSILAGTALVREAINSPNFVTGVSGWSVNKDGTAEFSNMTARGSVLATDPNNPDRYAYVRAGSLGVVQVPPDDYLQSELTPNLLSFEDVSTGTMYFTYNSGSGVHLRIAGKHGVSILHSDPRGFLRWNEDSINTDPEEWTDATLANGWTNHGAPYANVGYLMGPDGFVHLRGACRNGTSASGTRLFTLPVNYRPTEENIIPIQSDSAVSVQSRIQITTTGDVNVYDIGGNVGLRFHGMLFATI